MPRSKVLATYDSPAMFAVEDAAIKAGPAGAAMTFSNAKAANNFMLDFYGFRNAIWVAIERHKREDLRDVLTRISRIKCSKQGATLVFTDRTAMEGYSPATPVTGAMPPNARSGPFAVLEPPDETLARLGYTTDTPEAAPEVPVGESPPVIQNNPPPLPDSSAPIPPRKCT